VTIIPSVKVSTKDENKKNLESSFCYLTQEVSPPDETQKYGLKIQGG
jgi:hypothetical protein